MSCLDPTILEEVGYSMLAVHSKATNANVSRCVALAIQIILGNIGVMRSLEMVKYFW